MGLHLRNIRQLSVAVILLSLPFRAWASMSVFVADAAGTPLSGAMVSLTVAAGTDPLHTPDRLLTITRFTDEGGTASIEPPGFSGKPELRIRKPGYQDKLTNPPGTGGLAWITLDKLTDAELVAAQKPANLWLTQLDFRGFRNPLELRQHFFSHCGSCHQLGSAPFRLPADEYTWSDTIARMQSYGAALATDFSQPLAQYLSEAYTQLEQNFRLLPKAAAWQKHLRTAQMMQLPLGSQASRLGGVAAHPDGRVYVTDQLLDMLYEIDLAHGVTNSYHLPAPTDAVAGGLLASHFASYHGKVGSIGPYDITVAPRDGTVWISAAMQQQVIEFDPLGRQFTSHQLPAGYAPGRLAIDEQNRVWVTLRLSNQLAMLDRGDNSWQVYDLPSRRMKERSRIRKLQKKLEKDGIAHLDDYDLDTNGLPLPDGLSVSPTDGSIWISRRHARDLLRLDPDTGKVKRLPVPFAAPGSISWSKSGKLWISGTASGLVATYDPQANLFNKHPLPTASDSAGGLVIDDANNIVWVNGNQSDTILALDISTGFWKQYPSPITGTFSAFMAIDSQGRVYSSNTHFPASAIETGRPNLIRIQHD